MSGKRGKVKNVCIERKLELLPRKDESELLRWFEFVQGRKVKKLVNTAISVAGGPTIAGSENQPAPLTSLMALRGG